MVLYVNMTDVLLSVGHEQCTEDHYVLQAAEAAAMVVCSHSYCVQCIPVAADGNSKMDGPHVGTWQGSSVC